MTIGETPRFWPALIATALGLLCATLASDPDPAPVECDEIVGFEVITVTADGPPRDSDVHPTITLDDSCRLP